MKDREKLAKPNFLLAIRGEKHAFGDYIRAGFRFKR
jgi:hypothetical protein